MVARTHVGHNGDLATIEGQAFSQQTTSRSFKHGGIDIGVHQHIARAARAAAIAIVNLTAVDVDAIGVGHANPEVIGS